MNDGATHPDHASLWPGFLQMPAQLFPATLGLAGLAMAWQQADAAMGLATPVVPITLLAAAVLTNLLVTAGYAANATWHGHVVCKDLTTPASLVALATWPMSLMIIAAVVRPLAAVSPASLPLWVAGAGLYMATAIVFALAVWQLRPSLEMATPGWFVPTVGIAVAPSAGVVLGFADAPMVMGLVGCAAWLCLLPLMVWRLASRPALPTDQLPSLFVLIAPPALFSSAAAALDVGAMATALLFYLAALTTLPVLAMLTRRYSDIRAAGFSYSWWSATFPLAALAGAAQQTYDASPTAGHLLAAQGTLGLATLVTAAVSVLTLRSVIRRR